MSKKRCLKQVPTPKTLSVGRHGIDEPGIHRENSVVWKEGKERKEGKKKERKKKERKERKTEGRKEGKKRKRQKKLSFWEKIMSFSRAQDFYPF